MTRGRWLLTTATLAVLLVGCGVRAQDAPVPLPVLSQPAPASSPSASNGHTVTVYFVHFGRLAPVTRPAPDTLPRTALRVLVAGPDAAEAAVGLETALLPQELDASAGVRGALTVEAGPELTGITGDDQLLAVAQLVWTATAHAPTRRVRIMVEGRTIEVPTDDGLSRLPVGRDDYRTVAPLETTGTPRPSSPAPSSTPS
jgi:spore germination protein GerM